MKTPVEELNEILKLHKMWLEGKEGGVRANLSDAKLNRINLRGVNLASANLIGVGFSRANLAGANLSGANLDGAYLNSADLSRANLSDANLSNAYLNGADFTYANLDGADLSNANLNYADLSSASLLNIRTKSAIMPMHCKWNCSIVNDMIKIGCTVKTIEEWDAFFASDKEYETKRGTKEFLQIKAVYNAYKAYLETINAK